MSSTTKYRARWLFPIDAPPLENGVIEFDDRAITAVHNLPTPDALDLGNVALLPALINCHAHLEFSNLPTPLAPSTPFTSWIKSLVAYRRELPSPPVAAFQAGLEESAQSGVTLVGEIATSDWPLDLATPVSPDLILFRESLGRTSEQQRTQLDIARRHLQSKNSPSKILAGLSPHAPYSVHPDLLRDLVSLAVKYDAPLAMHLAETRSELQLLQHGTGEFADMLQAFGAWDPALYDGSRTILDDLRQLARASHALVIHGNYLAESDIDFLDANPHLSVIYCPRTHRYFGHEAHPWRQLLARGINVALGTDGRGSNPDLSIWNELRFLAQNFPDVPPSTLLRLPTLNAARALGVDRRLGSLTPGKSPRLIQFPLPESLPTSDPAQLLLSAPGQPRLCFPNN